MDPFEEKLEAMKRAARAYGGSVGALDAVRARLLEELGKAAEAWFALERSKRSGTFHFDLTPPPSNEDDEK